MFLLWHPSLTAINLSYTFPILETSATALCGTTGNNVIWGWNMMRTMTMTYDGSDVFVVPRLFMMHEPVYRQLDFFIFSTFSLQSLVRQSYQSHPHWCKSRVVPEPFPTSEIQNDNQSEWRISPFSRLFQGLVEMVQFLFPGIIN